MSAPEVDIISDIAPGLSPVTALHFGRVQVMLFRSHLADFAEEDLVYAMENAADVLGEEACLIVAPDETSVAICTFPVGLMMMEWGNCDMLTGNAFSRHSCLCICNAQQRNQVGKPS
uniref:Mating type protein A-3 n=1 Tax=Sordaria fimicola TaxID=27338 RepID=Q8J143_SORFI|nr:mating type protein A-3 [Sordaria fimicola]